MLGTVLTTKMHNQGLFWNFDTLKDYYGYSFTYSGTKMTITLYK